MHMYACVYIMCVCVCVCVVVLCVSNSFATPWTVSHQAPLSMGFSRQEYWSGSPLSSPGYLLKFQNHNVQKEYLFSVNIHSATSIPYVTDTVLQG